MSGFLARTGGLFLTPDTATADKEDARPAAAPPPPRFVAVLAARADLPAAAGGVAAALRCAAGARTAVVCGPGQPLPGRPGTPAATALARRLVARDVAAAQAGTLCRVALATDASTAVREVWRLLAAVEVPIILALPGRLDGFDDLLAEADELHLTTRADADEALVALASASLRRLGPPVLRAEMAPNAFRRACAAMGLAAGAGCAGARLEVPA